MAPPVLIREDRLIELYHAGVTHRVIAQEFGVTAGAVAEKLARLGLRRNRDPIKDTPKFRRAWQTCRTIAEVAEIMGYTKPSVVGAAKRFGYPDRQRARPYAGRPPVNQWDKDSAADPVLPHSSDQHSDLPRGLDRIGADRTARLVATGGRYAELADLAERWGITMTKVQQLWHQVRVAA